MTNLANEQETELALKAHNQGSKSNFMSTQSLGLHQQTTSFHAYKNSNLSDKIMEERKVNRRRNGDFDSIPAVDEGKLINTDQPPREQQKMNARQSAYLEDDIGNFDIKLKQKDSVKSEDQN